MFSLSNLIKFSYDTAVSNPFIDSNLSIVPPVNPSPRPDIFAITAPAATTSGNKIKVVVSATPPVLCLSTFIPSTVDKSKISPELAIAIVKTAVSS